MNLAFTHFSIFQIPYMKRNIYIKVQDELETTLLQPLSRRVHNWNLGGLGTGTTGWQIPPSFLHSDPTTKIITPSANLDMSLNPEFEPFRRLTSADLKILDFISTKGSFSTKADLSKTIKVSVPEISQRMNEYREANLIAKIFQFFNIGAEINVLMIVNSPPKNKIQWVENFLTFPQSDVYFTENNDHSIYFAFLKMPNIWVKDFSLKIHRIREEFPNQKIYYTFEPANIIKWNLDLKATYQPPK